MKFKPKQEDTRNFIKLKDGESIKGVFRGDLFEYRTHWAENRSIVCSGGGCELCAAGDKSKFRFRVNFIVNEDGLPMPKIFDNSMTVYDQLRELNDGGYDLESYFVKITRIGEKMQTTYSILPIPNGAVSDELQKAFAKIELNDLGHITDKEKEPPSNSEDIPF